MEEIGRSSNVSKARIHQIVKGVADYKKHYRSRRLTLVTAEIKRHMNYLDRDEQAVVLAALTTAYAADASG